MKRITVTLPDELAALVDRERRRRDVSAASVIRDAVEAHVRPHASNGGNRRVLRIAALGRGGGNVARNLEELLEAEAQSREALDAMMYGTSRERLLASESTTRPNGVNADAQSVLADSSNPPTS